MKHIKRAFALQNFWNLLTTVIVFCSCLICSLLYIIYLICASVNVLCERFLIHIFPCSLLRTDFCLGRLFSPFFACSSFPLCFSRKWLPFNCFTHSRCCSQKWQTWVFSQFLFSCHYQVLTWNNCTFFSLETRALISFWSSIVDVFTVLLSLRPLWFAVDISLSSFFYYLSSWLRALTEPRSAFSLMALTSELMSILLPVCWPCRVFERLRTSVPLQNISQ